LIFITLIGTIATYLATKGNNVMFYILIYIIAASLFLSVIGIIYFVKDKNQKSSLLLLMKRYFKANKDDTNLVKESF
jgi:hypothetical protein